MNRKTLLLIPLSLLLLIYRHAAAEPDGASREVDSLIEYASRESKKGNFDLQPVARRLLRLAEQRDDDKARLYGLMYMGHTLAGQVDDSVKWYYGQARTLAAQRADYRALAAISNALAIYTSEMEMNYLSGMSYFMEALKYAKSSPDKHSYPVILNNIAMAHYLRNDPDGLKYALEVVDIGTSSGEPLLIYSGSFVAAYTYYLLGEYSPALRYMEQALETGGSYIEYAEAYSLYANILVKLQRESEAVRYFRLSLEKIGEEKSNTLAYLNYGSYLIGKGRAGEAIGVLKKGLAFVDLRNNAFYRYQLYEKLSEAYAAAGDYRGALDYFMKFHDEFTDIFNLERERAINELNVQYETEKREREIGVKELALLRQKQKLNITLFTSLLLVGILAASVAGQRRKNLRYRQIVRQQHELIRKEKQIEQLTQPRSAKNETRAAGIPFPDEKGQELFARIEQLMKTEELYRERNITIEKIAERLATNRSYLSKAINEQGGMSFSQYVNSYRIDQARRTLSEPDHDCQIKELAYALGFSTPETFSASFKKAIGMLPSKFREEMRKMYDDIREEAN